MTYDIDGQLIGAPFMESATGFSKQNQRLHEISCQVWEGFIYVNLDSGAPSVDSQLRDLSSLIGDYRIENYVPVFETEETWETNWKCLVENFMDSYHIHRVHKDSFGQYGNYEDVTYLEPGGDGFSYHYIEEPEDRRSFFAHEKTPWLKGNNRRRTYLINIFPAHVIQLQPDLLWYLSLVPQGLGQVSVRWAVSIPAEILDNADDRQKVIDNQMALIHKVNSEDKPIVEERIQEYSISTCGARIPFSSRTKCLGLRSIPVAQTHLIRRIAEALHNPLPWSV